MPQRLATAARALTGSGVFEKTLDMPFLAYYGCSKLLKARDMFYWGTHTRYTASRHAVLEVPVVYVWTRELELVLYGKLYITWIRASYTWQDVKRNILPRFYGIFHACANSGAQAVFSLPRKKRPGNEAIAQHALRSCAVGGASAQERRRALTSAELQS